MNPGENSRQFLRLDVTFVPFSLKLISLEIFVEFGNLNSEHQSFEVNFSLYLF